MQKVRAIYSGRVQGVGFRATVYQLARNHVVYGLVRNVADGTVELIAMGESAKLSDFLQDIDRRMSRFITHCIVDWSAAEENEFQNFTIAPDR